MEYTITLVVDVPDEDAAYGMVERIDRDRRCSECDIEETNKRVYEERIRYEPDWMGQGEHFVFEGSWSDEEKWGLDTAFPLIDDMIHYTALTKVRELMKMGIPIHFAKTEEA